MPGNRVVRLLFEPFLEDLDRLVDLAERAVGQRQQSPSLGILRPERDDPGEADGRFARSLLAVEEDAEVVVGVRMLGIQADGDAIGLFRFDQLALRSQDHTEIVVGVGVLRIDCDGALIRGERFVQL